MRSIFWDNGLKLIDQTKLPERLEIIECKNIEELADAIKRLAVRGPQPLRLQGRTALPWLRLRGSLEALRS